MLRSSLYAPRREQGRTCSVTEMPAPGQCAVSAFNHVVPQHSHCQCVVQVTSAPHRFRTDTYHPYTNVDVSLLEQLDLPSPLDLDDMLPMQQAARERAVLRAVECYIDAGVGTVQLKEHEGGMSVELTCSPTEAYTSTSGDIDDAAVA